jgi:non-ribosomal peptide synthetase component E (peptide arylation enzyme)
MVNFIRVWDAQLTLEQICNEAAAHLPPYQLPKVLKEVDSLPRNAMGKINKKSLVKELFPEAIAAN